MGDYTCYIVCSEDIIALAVTQTGLAEAETRAVFSFLDTVHEKFMSYFRASAGSAVALAMNNEFR